MTVTVKVLKEVAKKLGIKYAYKMKKAELLEAIAIVEPNLEFLPKSEIAVDLAKQLEKDEFHEMIELAENGAVEVDDQFFNKLNRSLNAGQQSLVQLVEKTHGIKLASVVEECKDERQHIKVHSDGVIETTFTANGVFSSNLAKKISFYELDRRKDWKTAVVVFSKGSFTKDYSLIERSYKINSDCKYFNANMGGSSLFGNCLDGKDNFVRLDKYMYYENWEVEYCYIIENKEEVSC